MKLIGNKLREILDLEERVAVKDTTVTRVPTCVRQRVSSVYLLVPNVSIDLLLGARIARGGVLSLGSALLLCRVEYIYISIHICGALFRQHVGGAHMWVQDLNQIPQTSLKRGR